MTTAKQVINILKPKHSFSKGYKTPLGSAGYDNPREDIEKVKKLREASVVRTPTDNYDVVNKAYCDANCSTYIFIKATGQAEGDLHLSSATTWNVSKAQIKTIRVVTSSTDWDLYILQNDNGHAADDANIPEMQIMEQGYGNANIFLDLAYQDEDDSKEVHLYYVDNSGANTASIYIAGYALK